MFSLPYREQHRMWVPWDGPGLEHLRLHETEHGSLADGLILGVKDGAPFRARYQLHCDTQWRVMWVTLMLESTSWQADLKADGEGHWVDSQGMPIVELNGCVDVDISLTPYTNTTPIRRLGLQPGESADIAVAYFDILEKQWLSREMQRYTCLEARVEGGLYRFEHPSTGFSADLPVDADGLVLDYPALFKRIWSG